MARSISKLEKRAEELVAADKDPGTVGGNPKVSGMFSMAVMQAVFLFGPETWVLTPRMGRALGIFQQRVA